MVERRVIARPEIRLSESRELVVRYQGISPSLQYETASWLDLGRSGTTAVRRCSGEARGENSERLLEQADQRAMI